MNMMSENINELMAALSKAQGNIKNADKDKKSHYSKYADLTSVWDACRVALNENGLAVTQTLHKNSEGSFLLTTLGHSSGQFIKSEFYLILDKNNSMHALGSALTYARRYSLAALVGVCPEDDDGQMAEDELNATKFKKETAEKQRNNSQQQSLKPQKNVDYFPENKKPDDKLIPEQIKELSDALNLCSKEYVECFYKNIKEHWNVEKIEDILSSKFNALMSKIQLQLEAEKNV